MPELQIIDKHRRAIEFWRSKDAFATNLLIMFMDTYGDIEDDGKSLACLQWRPETIEMEIREDFGVDLPPISFSRLMTAINLLTSNAFFASLPTFINDCVVLSGLFVLDNTLVLPDSEDLAWGITESILISPLDKTDENPFSPEIIGFISETMDEEGILSPPDVLRIATRNQRVVDRVNAEFSDDPDMFESIQDEERAKTDRINQTMRSKLQALLDQLRTLPLQHGNAEFADKLQRGLLAKQN